MNQFLKFIFGIELYMFRTGFLSIIRSLVLYTQQQVYVVQVSSHHNLYDICLLLCIQYQTPDDGKKTSPKHIEFYYKNKFQKLVHPFGFIIRICHDARSYECQNSVHSLTLFHTLNNNSDTILCAECCEQSALYLLGRVVKMLSEIYQKQRLYTIRFLLCFTLSHTQIIRL